MANKLKIAGGNSKKIKRFFKKAFNLLAICGSVISTVKLIDFINAQKIENEKSKRRQTATIALIAVFGGILLLACGAYFFVTYVKSRRSGYFFDFFDRDSYDIIDPDEEDQYESIIRGELSRHEDSAPTERINVHSIPLDDEETEDSFK